MKKILVSLLVIAGVLGFTSAASAHEGKTEGKFWSKSYMGIKQDQNNWQEKRAEFKQKMEEYKKERKEHRAEFEAFVGLSVKEIREEKKDGKSMGEILEDQGKDREETEDFLEARADARVEVVVERRDLNDEQEENLRDRLYNFVQKLLDRWFGNN